MAKSRLPILLYRTHAWVGLLSGIFLILICTTGSVAIFKPELERALDWSNYTPVTPNGQPPISLERAIAVAQVKFPGSQVTSVNLPAVPGSIESHGDTYAIRLSAPKTAGGNRLVLVDPYRAEVLPAKFSAKGWGDWLRQLHVRMLYGSYWGRWVVGGFGLALVFSTVTGLLIFTRFNAGSWRLKLRRGRGPRIFLGDLHKTVGLSTVAFNLLFGLTGAVIGLEGLYYRYYAPKDNSLPSHSPVATLAPGLVDSCVEQSRTLIPGSSPSSVDFLHRKSGLVRVRVEHPATSLVKEHESSVLFDAATAAPVRVDNATTHSAAARLYYAMEPLHFGRLAGALWVKLLWGLMGLSGGLLSITGFAIYVLRRRKPRVAPSPALVAASQVTPSPT